jgi:hypothetical protein
MTTRSAAAVALLALAAQAQGAQLWVAPNGKDANPGTKARPVATLQRARDLARAAIAAKPSPVTITLRAGTYFLASPLELTFADSGAAGAPVTYTSLPGEAVTISGGVPVTGWKARPDGLLQAPIPAGGALKAMRQLFIGADRATRARWPNEEGALRLGDVSGDVKSFTLSQPIPGGDLAGTGAELVVYENWSVTRGAVTRSGGDKVETATPMGWIGHGPMTTASPGKPAFLEGGKAFLDQPGEWCVDGGSILYMPRPGETAANLKAVAPRLERLVVFQGAEDKPAQHITFRGITFAHTEFALPVIGYPEVQAGHYGASTTSPAWVQPVAVEAGYAEECRLERCTLRNLGGSGVGIGRGCKGVAVSRCTLADIGGNGVMVGWRGNKGAVRCQAGELDSDWLDPAHAPSGCSVTDCVITRCGATSPGCVGVFVAFSADTAVTNNHVYTMPYTGMSIGYRWSKVPSTQVRCLVANNHIHDVMKLLADGGGIYTLGVQPGTVLRENHIYDVHRSGFAHGGAPNNGFFVDESSTGFLFDRNLVYRTSGEPVRFNQCSREWHTWTDNLLGWDEKESPAATAIIKAAGPRK